MLFPIFVRKVPPPDSNPFSHTPGEGIPAPREHKLTLQVPAASSQPWLAPLGSLSCTASHPLCALKPGPLAVTDHQAAGDGVCGVRVSLHQFSKGGSREQGAPESHMTFVLGSRIQDVSFLQVLVGACQGGIPLVGAWSM